MNEGYGFVQDVTMRRQPCWHIRQQRPDLLGDLIFKEQLVIVAIARIDKAGIDVRDADLLNLYTRAFHYPQLYCAVGHVMVFDAAGGFDLDHVPAVIDRHENIGAHQRASMNEGCLEQWHGWNAGHKLRGLS